MKIRNTYSKRQKQQRGELPDVYQYDSLSEQLINQICHLITNRMGNCNNYFNIRVFGEKDKFPDYIYEEIYRELCFNWGEKNLITIKSEHNQSFQTDIFTRLENEENIEKCLDIIEICFSILEERKDEITKKRNINTLIDHNYQLISDLNQLFKEAATGYQFEGNQIVRVDSQLIHSEVVKPTLLILSSTEKYNGVLDEFMSAHEHYRNKKYKETLNDCLKSFESLMKAIHEKRNWAYTPNDTAKKLISSCLANNLIPEYLQNQFSSFRMSTPH
ncbi:TPA: hypothetical protein SMS20_000579 [Proteus mirabilis]|nr:hypothetical protein [Proteus mirabilis]